MIKERIRALRELMKRESIDAYLIVTDDYHSSEYVNPFFKEREFMSGFTGSAGTLVIMMDRACLWTDGRYFIQAASQLEGTGIELMKQGMEGVLNVKEFLLSELSEGQCIGFDGRTLSALMALDLKEKAEKKGIRLNSDVDLPGEIWTERPKLVSKPVWALGIEYAGMGRKEKLKAVREKLKEYEAEVFVLASVDDIAWLLNLRGDDVECNPVFLSYMIIFEGRAYLYADKTIFDSGVKAELEEAGVEIRGYNDVYENIKVLTPKNILLDKTKVNYAIINSIDKSKNIINRTNPTTELKAVKNPTERENMKRAHIKDGVAVTRFMHWIKKHVGEENITELSAAKKLEEFRKQQEGYLGPSFDPIFGYGEHGAIVHYSACEESNVRIEPRSFLLADTGGQYMEGTTDITRTFAMGPLTDEEKKMYTLALAGNLELCAAKFKEGVTGSNLDVLARQPLWNYGLDYNHGTGHGVGYLLNVHEGPQSIGYNRALGVPFKEGMVTSDEPGIYLEGKFGVRCENLMLCVEKEKNEYGTFLGFEAITMTPWDLEAVDKHYLTERQTELLNEYHRKVYEAISPYMEGEELKWLENATRPI